jgi:hypothetical protein
MLNGVDLSRVRAGDVLDIPAREAGMLLMSEWAVPLEQEGQANRRADPEAAPTNVVSLADAADRPRNKRSA